MIQVFVCVLGLIIVSAIIQDRFKIPSPITIISAVIGIKLSGYDFLHIDGKNFDNLVILTLPLLIATDAMKLTWSDLKKHGISLFWVAVVAVLLSVGVGVFINEYVLVDIPLSMAAVVILFCMVSATDPVTVSAVFSNFVIPHKLKILTEGESLLNDATALVVFSIALVALTATATVTPMFIATKTISVVGGAVLIGVVLGLMSVQFLKMSEDPLVEGAILLLTAYLAYMVAEAFHYSGILAVIVAIVLSSEKIRKLLAKSDHRSSILFTYKATTEQNHKLILKIFEFSSMFAAGALFMSMAALVDFKELFAHWKEILSVFVASTLIRGVMMMKFAIVSNSTAKMQNISKHWWSVLTFAGSKGALSILMVHMIPDSFEYKKLFETIIIGNIILSTFIYAAILSVTIPFYRKEFAAEVAEEVH